MRKLAIVVGLDLEADGDVAFQAALELARQHGGGPLHVVYVLGGYDPIQRLEYAYEAQKLDLAAERARLGEHVAGVLGEERAGELPIIVQHVLAGPPAKELVRVAHGVNADLIVVGTHGKHGVKRVVLGSVAEEVLRQAHCPVLVARTKSW